VYGLLMLRQLTKKHSEGRSVAPAGAFYKHAEPGYWGRRY